MGVVQNKVTTLKECQATLAGILENLNTSLLYNDEQTVEVLYNELNKLVTILNENMASVESNATAIDVNKVW